MRPVSSDLLPTESDGSLQLWAVEEPERLAELCCAHSDARLDSARVATLLDDINRVLAALVTDPDAPVSSLGSLATLRALPSIRW